MALREGSEFALKLSLFLQSMTNVACYPQVPPCGGKASPPASYEEKIPRGQIPTIETSRRAANLLLHMTDIAFGDGAQQILRILRERLAPDAVDAIRQKSCDFCEL